MVFSGEEKTNEQLSSFDDNRHLRSLSGRENPPDLVMARNQRIDENAKVHMVKGGSAAVEEDTVVDSSDSSYNSLVFDSWTPAGWGSSGLVSMDWIPPPSLFLTSNTPRDSIQLNTMLVVMTLGWMCLSFLIKRVLGPKYNASYVSRVVSLIHAAASTAYCLYTILLRFLQHSGSTLSFTKHVCCLPEPPLADEQFAALLTASYFLCDTLGLLFGDYFDGQFLAHHVGALAILGTSLVGQKMGLEIAVGIVILECTNIQMHLRWLLQNNGFDSRYPKSLLWWGCDTGFLVSFAFSRLIVGTVASVSFLMCPSAPLHISFFTFAFLAFSFRFFVKCVQAVRNGQPWES